MPEIPNKSHSKLQDTYTDARKAKQGLSVPKKMDEADDESGGGNGKKMQSSYKLEKLLGVLEKGRVKAQNFWRFLAKEGLDSHETKKTTLATQKEEATKVSEKTEKSQEITENQDRAKEITSEKKSEAGWQKAKALKALDSNSSSAAQRFGFQDASPFSITSNSAAEATRRSVMGNRLAGSITSGTTNPLGFAKQIDITGEASKANAKPVNQPAGKVSSMFTSKQQSGASTAPESAAATKQAATRVR